MHGVTPLCPYCGDWSTLVTGKVIYPHRPDLYYKRFYLCAPCDAYVGCHDHNKMPLGTLANATLRGLRKRAHATFDPIWKTGKMNRTQAYYWLADKMGLKSNDCHIAKFSEAQCRQVIDLVSSTFYESAS